MSSVTQVGHELSGEGKPVPEGAGLERFWRGCLDGQDIEELILQDAARQRRAAGALRRFCRESQRRLVAEAARKIIRASWRDFLSTAFGAAVQVGVAYACYQLEIASGLAQLGAENETAKLLAKAKGSFQIAVTQASGTLLSGLGAAAFGGAKERGRAERLQVEAGIQGQRAGEATDWLRDIKELESKLIAHLEKTLELDHQAQRAINRGQGN